MLLSAFCSEGGWSEGGWDLACPSQWWSPVSWPEHWGPPPQKHLQGHSLLLKKLLLFHWKGLILLVNDLLRQKEVNVYWLLPMPTQNHCLLPLSASRGLVEDSKAGVGVAPPGFLVPISDDCPCTLVGQGTQLSLCCVFLSDLSEESGGISLGVMIFSWFSSYLTVLSSFVFSLAFS